MRFRKPSEPPTEVFIDLRERLAPYSRGTDDEPDTVLDLDLGLALEPAPVPAIALTAPPRRAPSEPYHPRHMAPP